MKRTIARTEETTTITTAGTIVLGEIIETTEIIGIVGITEIDAATETTPDHGKMTEMTVIAHTDLTKAGQMEIIKSTSDTQAMVIKGDLDTLWTIDQSVFSFS